MKRKDILNQLKLEVESNMPKNVLEKTKQIIPSSLLMK